MDGPKAGGGASWWAALPSILTGLAAVLTAIGGLIAAVTQILPLLSSTDRGRAPPARPDPVAPPTPTPVAPAQVDGVGVAVVSTRRTGERGAAAVELHYRLSTGAEPFAHDPERFVRLVAGEKAFVPLPAPAARITLPPRAVQDVLVRFVVPGADAASPLRFRFGEGRPIDLPPRWPD